MAWSWLHGATLSWVDTFGSYTSSWDTHFMTQTLRGLCWQTRRNICTIDKYDYRLQYTVSLLWEVTTQKWINEAFESQMLCLPASISDCDCARHESTVSNQTGVETSIFKFISLQAWKTMCKQKVCYIYLWISIAEKKQRKTRHIEKRNNQHVAEWLRSFSESHSFHS